MTKVMVFSAEGMRFKAKDCIINYAEGFEAPTDLKDTTFRKKAADLLNQIKTGNYKVVFVVSKHSNNALYPFLLHSCILLKVPILVVVIINPSKIKPAFRAMVSHQINSGEVPPFVNKVDYLEPYTPIITSTKPGQLSLYMSCNRTRVRSIVSKWLPLETELERSLLKGIDSVGISLGDLDVQHSIGNYVADFAFLSTKLVVEADGPCHNSKREKDYVRDRALLLKGYTVLRYSLTEITGQPLACGNQIKKFLKLYNL